MDFNELTTEQLLTSIEAETAKSLNEVRHAQDDIDKALSRIKFTLAVIHHLKNKDIKE